MKLQNIDKGSENLKLNTMSGLEKMHAEKEMTAKEKQDLMVWDTIPNPNLFLKNCASALATPLSHIFDVSFKDQKLPLEWKIALVTPIHKKGPTTSPENYRPISDLYRLILFLFIQDYIMNLFLLCLIMGPSGISSSLGCLHHY